MEESLKEVYPGLYKSSAMDVYIDAEGATYDSIEEYKQRTKEKTTTTISFGQLTTVSQQPIDYQQDRRSSAPKYKKRPHLTWKESPLGTAEDAQKLQEKWGTMTLYRFCDIENIISLMPYPAKGSVEKCLKRLAEENDRYFDHRLDERSLKRYFQTAQLTVTYGRDDSPFSPCTTDYHSAANNRNLLMQEMVRTPKYYELDPIRDEMPKDSSKRAPHIVRLEVPKYKLFGNIYPLIVDTTQLDENAGSVDEREVYGPLWFYVVAYTDNPY